MKRRCGGIQSILSNRRDKHLGCVDLSIRKVLCKAGDGAAADGGTRPKGRGRRDFDKEQALSKKIVSQHAHASTVQLSGAASEQESRQPASVRTRLAPSYNRCALRRHDDHATKCNFYGAAGQTTAVPMCGWLSSNSQNKPWCPHEYGTAVPPRELASSTRARKEGPRGPWVATSNAAVDAGGPAPLRICEWPGFDSDARQ